MERIRVTLEPEEFSGLVRLCESELRTPPDQLRHMLREKLRERKLLSPPRADRTLHAEEASRDAQPA